MNGVFQRPMAVGCRWMYGRGIKGRIAPEIGNFKKLQTLLVNSGRGELFRMGNAKNIYGRSSEVVETKYHQLSLHFVVFFIFRF